MPSSKEVRARQNRAKERAAAASLQRRAAQRRRRTIGGIVGVVLIVGAVVIGAIAAANSGNDNKAVAVSPTSATAATTAAPSTTVGPTTTVAQPPQKACVGLKDPLPKGSPAIPLTAEAAPTRLKEKDLTVGTGAVVPKNAKVTVNYVGIACSTGKIFDSSYSSGQPFDADLSGGVIAGWMQGIPGMKVGGVRLLAIPSSLGYGTTGNGPDIPPNEALYFLVSVEKID